MLYGIQFSTNAKKDETPSRQDKVGKVGTTEVLAGCNKKGLQSKLIVALLKLVGAEEKKRKHRISIWIHVGKACFGGTVYPPKRKRPTNCIYYYLI
jgi:hypothetical protein